MTETATLASWDAVLKDLYVPPGTVLKQWVMDMRRESAWERETCPRVATTAHEDNTGCECRNSNDDDASWRHLDHDCCDVCEALHDATASRPDVVAWLAEKAARPPIERDHSKLSGEVEPEWTINREHPMLAMLPRSKP